MMDGLSSYGDVGLLKRMGLLIRNHSENRQGIWEVAKKELDWRSIHTILNLGCGYGAFEETLETGFDLVVGIDFREENREYFLGAAGRIADRSVFECLELPSMIDMASGSFDLAVCAYSLYFFPEMLREVWRLLAAGGTFLCITHSESMMEEVKDFSESWSLKELIQGFSAENGQNFLKKYFPSVLHIDYHNRMVFKAGDSQDLIDYIHFKAKFVARYADPGIVEEKLLRELNSKGELKLNKDDRIFIARKVSQENENEEIL